MKFNVLQLATKPKRSFQDMLEEYVAFRRRHAHIFQELKEREQELKDHVIKTGKSLSYMNAKVTYRAAHTRMTFDVSALKKLLPQRKWLNDYTKEVEVKAGASIQFNEG